MQKEIQVEGHNYILLLSLLSKKEAQEKENEEEIAHSVVKSMHFPLNF